MQLYKNNPILCSGHKEQLLAILLRMKATVFFILLTLFQLKAEIKAQTVSLNLRNATLSELFRELKKQTGYDFFYVSSDLDRTKRVSIHVKDVSIEEALKIGIADQPLAFEISDKTIYIKRSATSKRTTVRQEIITGIITDSLGVPIPSVSVRVKGSATQGTNTDVNGRFSLQAPLGTTLIFSNVGYESQEFTVSEEGDLKIILQSLATALDEIVVVGFGQQRKISNVGAQSTIKPTELKQPVANITTLLAGRMAGVIGVQRSGEPGRNGADIWIRGISTFGGNDARPLILVDGVERSINNIDPEDIESFTILKDASGTAVYGVRGANGVVLVKTKTGKIGKPQVYFDYNEGVNTFTAIPEMLNGIDYMNLANEARTNRNQSPIYSQEYIDNTRNNTDPLLYPNVNWMDEIFERYGRNRRANLNVSGGVDNAQYYVSLNYYNETGLLKTDGLENYNSDLTFTRYNFTSNLNLNITPTTKIDLGIQGYLSNGNYPGENSWDIFGSAMDVSPVEYPVMYPGGFIPGKSANGGFRNPYADLTRRGYRNENRNQLYTNLRATQNLDFLTSGLSATAMFSFDTYNEHIIARRKREPTWFVDMTNPYREDGSLNLIQTFTPGGGAYLGYDRSNGGSRQFYVEGAINYDRSFDKHRVSGLGLFYSNDYNNAFAGDFTSSIPERYLGFAGRATYSYDERYFLEANFGYNGSELFAPANRFGFFPAFGLGWVVSNEQFFEPLTDVISFLKFRYSDGMTGIGRIDQGRRFAYLDILSDNAPGYTFGRNFNHNSGFQINDFGVDIRWAESRKQNLGIELNAFNNQFQLIVDLFKEHRTGIFLQRQTVVDYIGIINRPWGNLGAVDNRGIDANLQYNAQIGDVRLELRGNLTFNQDKLLEDDRPPQPYPWMDRRGHNILSIWGYQAEKLFDSEEEIANSAVPGDRSRVMPGDIKYVDMNGDGLINDYDMVRIGRGDVPATVWGAGFNISYRGFNVGALFQGQHNADRLLGGSAILPFNGGGGLSNAYSIATDRWTAENPRQDVFYPRLAYGEAENFNNTQPSSWYIRDMSFIRLKSADISYSLSSALLDYIRVRSATVYLQGINLLTFSDFKLWDPELNTNNGTSYPNVRTMVLGVNFRF